MLVAAGREPAGIPALPWVLAHKRHCAAKTAVGLAGAGLRLVKHVAHSAASLPQKPFIAREALLYNTGVVGGLIPKFTALSFGASVYGKALPVRFY